MDKITMLGTGHAMTFSCFNTCFVYENDTTKDKFLTDTGGGQQLLLQLQRAGISSDEITDIFISHRHTDHLTGLPWLFRTVDRPKRLGLDEPDAPKKTLRVFLQPDLMRFVPDMLLGMFPDTLPKLVESGEVQFIPVHDGDTAVILGNKVTFYDLIASCPQYGYRMELGDGKDFVFHGDVPFQEPNRDRFTNAAYLMHEAFNLESEPMPMPRMPDGKGPLMMPPPHGGPKKMRHHSTVKDCAGYAESLGAKNLIIVHGSDNDLEHRKAAYTAEAQTAYHGNIYVPDDLDVIELK